MRKIILIFTILVIYSNSYSQYSQYTIDESDKLLEKKEVSSGDKFRGAKFLEKPTLEMSYGISEIGIDGLSSGLSPAGMLELKLGYSTQRKSYYNKKSVLKYLNGFTFLSVASTDLNTNVKSVSELNSETWRFGLGMKQGYGVEIGESAIMPYTSGAFVWSRLNLQGTPGTLAENDLNLLSNFNESFRFGTLSESGINLQIVPLITLQAKYERAIVFPRHLFAVQMGSMFIETVGAYMLGDFIDNVMRNSPVLGTIVSFALKSGYSYGIYELRKSEMNWPFGGEAPLSFDTYKVGMTFTF